MALVTQLTLLLLFLSAIPGVPSLLLPGVVELNSKDESSISFVNALYDDTSIFIKVECEDTEKDDRTYSLQFSMCFDSCWRIKNCTLENELGMPRVKEMHCKRRNSLDLGEHLLIPLNIETEVASDDSQSKIGKALSEIPDEDSTRTSGAAEKGSENGFDQEESSSGKSEGVSDTRKEDPEQPTIRPPKETLSVKTQAAERKVREVIPSKNTPSQVHKAQTKPGVSPVATTTRRGFYSFVVALNGISKTRTVKVTVEMSRHGSHLSLLDWPLLPFFGAMSLLYLLFAIIWLVLCCLNWRDLLRVQFWIGGVIALGMFENALFYSEYNSINATGKANGLLYFAELVSCVKRALARILVIIISLGFGIVKPRLGEALPKVLAVGGLYTLLSAIEGMMRIHHGNINADETKNVMYSAIPLTVVDVIICYWVFTSLVQTTRTLSIRKNTAKLSLYRHFTNTLVFMVVVSIAYMIWTIKDANTKDNCSGYWTVWVNDCLWPFLFAIILAVIIFLWRPSKNSRRYEYDSFIPLNTEDDDDDRTLSDAFESMKLRNVKTGQDMNGSLSKSRAEEDLKWVEENIPSVPPSLLPVLDSDEEVMTTKFERSKMN